MAWKSSFRQNYLTTFSPTVPTSAAGISHVVANVEAPGSEKWEHMKSGGKQWQATPKDLPRMQRTRAIPVAWLNSGLCPDWPTGWIPIIIIIIIIESRINATIAYNNNNNNLQIANVKLRNLFKVRNNITYSTNCKCRTAAILYTLETWFVSGI